MKTAPTVSSVWSTGVENETVLNEQVNTLFDCAQFCASEPGEESASKACSVSRHVSDTTEGMLFSNVSIPPSLLARAIQGISDCIIAISRMDLPAEVPTQTVEHLQKMINDMMERREDLGLLQQSKMAYLHRLRERRLKCTGG